MDVVRTRGQGWRGVAVELGFVGIALLCNLAVRQYTVHDVDRAVVHARQVLDLQQVLGLDWEHAVQDATLDIGWLADVSSWFYVWGYFPVVAAALVGLYARRPEAYAGLRNALLASGVVGLFFYAFYPTAPPRLTDLGYADPVLSSGSLDAAARPVGLANELAAIPSFHIAWLVVVAVAVYRTTGSRVLRAACVLHPVVMSYAVVATGNHWVLDVPAGVALAAVGLAVARWLQQSPLTVPAPQPMPAAGTAGMLRPPRGR